MTRTYIPWSGDIVTLDSNCSSLYLFFFLSGFYGPFKNISLISSRSFIEVIVHRSRAKTGEPGEKPPDHP